MIGFKCKTHCGRAVRFGRDSAEKMDYGLWNAPARTDPTQNFTAVDGKRAFLHKHFLLNNFRKILVTFLTENLEMFITISSLMGYRHRMGVYQNVDKISIARLLRKFGHASILPVKSQSTMNISASFSQIAKSFGWLYPLHPINLFPDSGMLFPYSWGNSIS